MWETSGLRSKKAGYEILYESPLVSSEHKNIYRNESMWEKLGIRNNCVMAFL